MLVRDSHGSKQNLLPSDVDPRARLLRGASTGPKNMMEGIDSTFDAVVFIGYHAKAGTPNAILEHTSNGNVVDFSINGVSLPEGGYNALVAGLVNVPVVFIVGRPCGRRADARPPGPIEGVAVKEEIGDASLGMSPKQAQDEIRKGVRAGRAQSRASEAVRAGRAVHDGAQGAEEKPLTVARSASGDGEFTFSSPTSSRS